LGVITKDERRLGHNRVYTQFVFHVRLPVTDRNIDRFVRQISTGGTTLYRLSARDDPEGLFRGQDGKVNTMDIVAWRALHRRRKREDHGAASFWRDFLIV
jgi:hypothetical protein